MAKMGELLTKHDAKQRSSKPPTPTAESSAKRRRRLTEGAGKMAIVASAYMPADLDMPARVKIINNFWDCLGALDDGDIVIFALAPT